MYRTPGVLFQASVQQNETDETLYLYNYLIKRLLNKIRETTCNNLFVMKFILCLLASY